MNQISQLSSDLSAALIVDLASGIWPESEVLANHGFSAADGAFLIRQDWFKKALDQARSDWNGITNARQRIRLKAQVAVEETIKDIFDIIQDKNTPAAARVAAFKELKDMSGTGGTVTDGSQGATGPQVNIFLNGSDSPTISVAPSRKLNDNNDIIDIVPNSDDEAGVVFGMMD